MKKKKANNEIRTRDLSLTKRVLYQLSYIGSVVYCFLKQFLFVSNPSDEIKKNASTGNRTRATCLEGRYSNH